VNLTKVMHTSGAIPTKLPSALPWWWVTSKRDITDLKPFATSTRTLQKLPSTSTRVIAL